MKLTKLIPSTIVLLAALAHPVYATNYPANPNGSATSANSAPVVPASDWTPNLPSNAAKEAGGNLATIVTNTNNIPARGQATGPNSAPVVLAAPNISTAAAFTSPHAAGAYAAGQLVGNSATAGAVVPMAFAVAPANGVPVYITGGSLKVTTASSGGVAPSLTNGIFSMQLYGQSPTIASGDGATFSTTTANWCGALYGTLYLAGTDYGVTTMAPAPGLSYVACTPGGSSQTVYGLLRTEAAWTPSTTTYTYTGSIVAQ